MSRTSLLTAAMAVLALGAGVVGFAATRQASEQMHAGVERIPGRRMPTLQRAPPPPDRVIEASKGEGLAAALLRAGVGGLDAALAERAGGQLSGRLELWLGQRVGTQARALQRLELRLGAARKVVIERQGDAFSRRVLVEAVDLTPVRIRLGGSEIAAGLVASKLPRTLRNDVLDRVAGAKVAAIDLIVEHEAGVFGSRYGAPIYLGLYLADGSIKRWMSNAGQFTPLTSDEQAPGGLLRPLPGPVTSHPGLRFHPILRFLRWHRGTDFAGHSGTPVQAALEGRVTAAGWQGGYGRIARIAHGDGSTTLYGHLSQVDVGIGQEVARGAVIGKVGSSGLATGPHLHFEWQRNGAMLPPNFSDEALSSKPRPMQQAALRTLLSAPFRLPPDRGS